MSTRLPAVPILKYYAFQASYSAGFIWPVFTLFLLWNDLSFAQIGTLSAVSAILVVVLEVPTGYVADRIGRRTVLAVSMAAMAASVAGFVVAEAFVEFVALYAVWAVAMAFRSGTADAWLYDALDERLRADEFTRIRGRGGAVYEYTSAITMIVGGALYVVHPTYPFVASALLHGCGVAVVASMPRNARYGDEAGARDDEETPDRLGVREVISVIRGELLAGPLRAFVAFVAAFFAVVQAADTYVQPIAEDVLADVLASFGAAAVPEAALLGVLYACFAVVGAVASDNAERIRSLVGLRAALLWLPVVVALSFLAPLSVSLLAIPVFVVMKGAHALSKPLVNQYINDRTGSVGRATVLSAASMSYAFVRAPLKPLAGIVADLTTPIATVAGLGALFLVAAATLALVSTPVLEPEGRPAPSD